MMKLMENWVVVYGLQVIHQKTLRLPIQSAPWPPHTAGAGSSPQPLPTEAEVPRLEITFRSAAAGRLPLPRISTAGHPFIPERPTGEEAGGHPKRSLPPSQLGDLVLLTLHPAEAA